MDEALRETVVALVAKHLDCARATIRGDSRLYEDLQGDSLTLVRLHLALEERFEIEIGDERAATLHTVDDVVAFVSTAVRGATS